MAANGGDIGYNAASADVEDVTMAENTENTEQPLMAGHKRPFPGANSAGGGASKKKKKPAAAVVPKNALMQLNEIRPGLQYTLLYQSPKMHDPSFTIGVEINGQKFSGTATSKKKAKQLAAEKALASFLAVPDSVEALKIKQSGALDFTSDQGVGSSSYNSFDGEEPPPKPAPMGLPVTKTQPPGKNPVMVLNEIKPGTQYNFIAEEGDNHNKNFIMEVVLEGKTFQGNGRNKKLAKARAAQAALKQCYNLEFTNPPEDQLDALPIYEGDQAVIDALRPQTPKFQSSRKPMFGAVDPTTSDKHPVQRLNELFSGLIFDLVEPGAAFSHAGLFKCCVDVEGQPFEGMANTKKDAKINCAQAALDSLTKQGIIARREMELRENRKVKAEKTREFLRRKRLLEQGLPVDGSQSFAFGLGGGAEVFGAGGAAYGQAAFSQGFGQQSPRGGRGGRGGRGRGGRGRGGGAEGSFGGGQVSGYGSSFQQRGAGRGGRGGRGGQADGRGGRGKAIRGRGMGQVNTPVPLMDQTGGNEPFIQQVDPSVPAVSSFGFREYSGIPNPVAKLNFHHPGLEYKIIGTLGEPPFQQFNMQVIVSNMAYLGSGRNKKLAKNVCAEKALKALGLWTEKDEEAKKEKDQEMESKYVAPPAPKPKEQTSSWGSGGQRGAGRGNRGGRGKRGGGGFGGRGGGRGGGGFKSTLNQGFTQFQSGGQLASYATNMSAGYGTDNQVSTESYQTGYYGNTAADQVNAYSTGYDYSQTATYDATSYYDPNASYGQEYTDPYAAYNAVSAAYDATAYTTS